MEMYFGDSGGISPFGVVAVAVADLDLEVAWKRDGVFERHRMDRAEEYEGRGTVVRGGMLIDGLRYQKEMQVS